MLFSVVVGLVVILLLLSALQELLQKKQIKCIITFMAVMVALGVPLARKATLGRFMCRQQRLLMLTEKNCLPQRIRQRSIQ